MSPQSARNPDLVGGLKAVIEQAKSVQLLQPLTLLLLDVTLAPQNILGVLGIHQIHFQATAQFDARDGEMVEAYGGCFLLFH